jgi:thiazole synthase
VKSVVEEGGAEIVTLALRRANLGGEENILDIYQKELPYCPIPPGPEMRRKP